MRVLFLDSFLWVEGEPMGMMQLSALARATSPTGFMLAWRRPGPAASQHHGESVSVPLGTDNAGRWLGLRGGGAIALRGSLG